MIRLSSLIGVISLVMLSGCIFDDSDNSGNKGEYLDSYFPLNPKLIRKYLVTTSIDTLQTLSYSIRKFHGKITIEGNEYYVLITEGSETASYYRMDNDILYRYYFDGEKLYVPYAHEEPVLDFSKNPGESWDEVKSTFRTTYQFWPFQSSKHRRW